MCSVLINIMNVHNFIFFLYYYTFNYMYILTLCYEFLKFKFQHYNSNTNCSLVIFYLHAAVYFNIIFCNKKSLIGLSYTEKKKC